MPNCRSSDPQRGACTGGLTRSVAGPDARASASRAIGAESVDAARADRDSIQLETRDAYRAFRAELRTRIGDEVLIRSNLPRRRIGAASAVAFEVPASALGLGEYELALKGVASNRPEEGAGYYYFSVQH